MTTTTPLGEMLRAARLKAGMSQADLAKATGIIQTRISRYESGHIQPRASALSLIFRNLNVPQGMVAKYAYHDLAWRELEGSA